MADVPLLIIETSEPRVERELDPFKRNPSMDELEAEIEFAVKETVDARAAGAAIAHLHGISVLREDPNYPIVEVDATAELFRRIAAKTDIIRTYARAAMPLDQRTEVVQKSGSGKPELGAVIMSDTDFAELDRQLIWSRKRIGETLRWYLDMGIAPECEVFQVGATWNLRWAVEQKLLEAPRWINVICEALGFGWAPGTVESIQHRVQYFPPECIWHATAFCEPRTPFPVLQANALLMHVIGMGGHIRIGREDRLWIRPGEPAKSNAELVELVVWMAKTLGRRVATPDEARRMLRIPRTNH